MSPRSLRRLLAATARAVIEFALVMPLVVVLVLGVVEFGYALLDQHVVTKTHPRRLEPHFARHARCRTPPPR